MTVLVGALTLVVALLTLLVVGLLRSHGEILRRLHALDGGTDPDTAAADVPVDFRVRPDLPQPGGGEVTRAPDLGGVGLTDDVVTISVGGVGHRTLIAFLSSNCLTCQAFWEAFAARSELGLPDDVRVVIVTKDAAEESRSALVRLAPAGVPLLMSSVAWAEYSVPGSPYFVLVDGATRRVRGEGTGLRWDQVRDLLTEAAADQRLDDASARGAGANGERTNEARIDRALTAAGITPGDPSLYQPAAPGAETGAAAAGGAAEGATSGEGRP